MSKVDPKKDYILVILGIILVSVGIFAVFFFPFAFEQYNVGETAKTVDVRKDDPYVYGDKGQPARQTKNTYADTPEGQKRADDIREKWFGAGITAETGNADGSVKTDSTTKDAEKDKKPAEPTEKKM